MNNRILKILPLIVLLVGASIAVAMIKSRPETVRRAPEALAPLVRTITVERVPHRFQVTTQGTVVPRTESALVSEVRGEVMWISDAFAAGAFFEPGETLLRIDPIDYEAAVTQAASTVAEAELRVAREEEEAVIAREEYADLGMGEPTPLALREPQLAQARAALAAAQAAKAQAERDLDRTRIRAPFAGRVRSKNADRGQFVNAGTMLGMIFAVDRAEVRLPLAPDELAYLEIPMSYQGALEAQRNPENMPSVVLHARYGGVERTWEGRIERIEGEVDPATRMVYVVAAVDDPYGRQAEGPVAPLVSGLFVEADITGRAIDDVILLPRGALQRDDRLLIVDDDCRLRFREVEILRRSRERIVVGAGLEPGERVCMSQLDAVTDGMRVRVYGDLQEPEEVAGP
jgi:RND family efflux transporter MFP subunit